MKVYIAFYKICISKATATRLVCPVSLYQFYKICISKATATLKTEGPYRGTFYKICISKATATKFCNLFEAV